MNVTLKPELEQVIAAEVEAGRAPNSDEFLNRAVYHYTLARDLGEDYSVEEFDKLIAAGLDDIEKGDLVDGEEALYQLRSRLVQRRRHQEQRAV